MMKEILYDWNGANLWLFHAINGIHTPGLDEFMRIGTALGGHSNWVYYLSALLLCAIIITPYQMGAGTGRDEAGIRWLLAIAVFVFAYFIEGFLLDWIKPTLHFPRPFIALNGMANILSHAEDHTAGFPSGHSTFAMLVGATFWMVTKHGHYSFIIRLTITGFVLWVGISRISLGVHFPADVLGGYVFSLLVVLLVRSIVVWVMKMGQRAGAVSVRQSLRFNPSTSSG
jgi:membrane-associated phospholipid phosphatase